MFNDKPLGLTLAVLYWLTIGGMLISSGGLTLFGLVGAKLRFHDI